MSARSDMRQPRIADPALRWATGAAFLLGYNWRVSGRGRFLDNPYSQTLAPRQWRAWRKGWDLADKTGLLVELPQ